MHAFPDAKMKTLREDLAAHNEDVSAWKGLIEYLELKLGTVEQGIDITIKSLDYLYRNKDLYIAMCDVRYWNTSPGIRGDSGGIERSKWFVASHNGRVYYSAHITYCNQFSRRADKWHRCFETVIDAHRMDNVIVVKVRGRVKDGADSPHEENVNLVEIGVG